VPGLQDGLGEIDLDLAGTTQRPSRLAGPKIPLITRPPSRRTG
jgi:hypothetical protein